MTIRSRLLTLLLPTLTALIGLIASFFYFNWSHEILNSFRTQLKSIVVASVQSINSSDIEWLNEHLNDADLLSNPIYKNYRRKLTQLKKQLPIDNMYIVRIEPARKGDLPENRDQTGEDYKQVFLLDTEQSEGPGQFDYSETEERQIYLTKKPLVTSPYESRKTGERFISAYAPIMNERGDVLALLGADVSMTEIDRKLKKALLVISISSLVALLLVTTTVFWIANKISRPVQQLNQAALNIAAGDYESDIQVEGPKEIVELSNTFNTMSECLVEKINRLKETSLLRERLYGEYECAVLLQYYMLQKVVEEFKHPSLKMRLVSANFSNNQKGLALLLGNGQGNFELSLLEAEESGFEPLYQLSKIGFYSSNQPNKFNYIYCQFLENYSILQYHARELFPPLVWSIQKKQFVRETERGILLEDQEMIFLYNSDFIDQFKTEEKIEFLFAKVLRHFAEDGLETIQMMLTNELTFLAKRENLKGNFQIICLQKV